jgi:hypothetical protein
MTEISSSVVADIWDYFGDFIPANKKEDAVCKLVELFAEYVTEDWFDLVRGVDPSLDHAMDLVFEEEHDDYPDDNDDE